MKISKHFTLAEVEKSERALRLGIDNTAPEFVVDAAAGVAVNVMDKVREHFWRPITPTSWYRCPEVDAAIRSKAIYELWKAGQWKPKSQHINGSAVDFEIGGVPNTEVAQWIADNLEFDQLILEFFSGPPNSGWIHVSFVIDGENRQEMLTTADGKTYQSGLHY